MAGLAGTRPMIPATRSIEYIDTALYNGKIVFQTRLQRFD